MKEFKILLFLIFIKFWCSILCTGEITYLIAKINWKYTLYQTKIEEIEAKITLNKIPKEISEKIMHYYEISWERQKFFSNIASFTDLSEPLQRELMFFAHKDIVINVPLFKALEPVEIYRITQRLRTHIYLPKDKIIQEGERATEMFFLTDGLAEVVICKDEKDEGNVISLPLMKGSYFGEIALITNSLRTSDVNAVDYCTVEIFSKTDFEALKREFPDIATRLKEGLKNYKNNHIRNISNVVKKHYLFQSLDEDELNEVIKTFMDEHFVESQEVILRPKKRLNGIYFILLGKIKKFNKSEESKKLITELVRNKRKQQRRSYLSELEERKNIIDSIDDEMKDFPPLFQDDMKVKLNEEAQLGTNDSFGALDFDDGEPETSENYYFSESPCQLCVLTQGKLERLKIEKPNVYNMMKKVYLEKKKSSPSARERTWTTSTRATVGERFTFKKRDFPIHKFSSVNQEKSKNSFVDPGAFSARHIYDKFDRLKALSQLHSEKLLSLQKRMDEALNES